MNKKTLFVILIFFVVLQLIFVATRHHDLHWDESVYISMGKYIYSFGEQGMLESIRPFGLPLLLGFVWKLGIGTPLAYQSVITLFAIGTLLLTFDTVRLLRDEDTAIYATAILALTPLFLQGSFAILTEIPTAFFLVLTMWCMIKKRHPILIGVSASCAFLLKFPAGLLLIIVLLLLWHTSSTTRRARNCVYAIGGFILIQIPYFIFNHITYREYTKNWVDAAFRPVLLGQSHSANPLHAVNGLIENLFFYPYEFILNNPLLIFVVLCIFFLWENKYKQTRQYIMWPLIIFLLFFTAITNKQLRFGILFLPWFVMLAALGVKFMIQNMPRFAKGVTILTILILTSTLALYPNYVTTYRYYPTIEQPIEQEYYGYFGNNNREGTILTTEPYFTAHDDNLIAIPYYNNVTDAHDLYQKNREQADYIVFNPDFFPCPDIACEEQKKALEEQIRAENELLYEEAWRGSTKSIFKTTGISS